MNTALTVRNRLHTDGTCLTTVSGPKAAYGAYVAQLKAMEETWNRPVLISTRCVLSVADFVAQILFRVI